MPYPAALLSTRLAPSAAASPGKTVFMYGDAVEAPEIQHDIRPNTLVCSNLAYAVYGREMRNGTFVASAQRISGDRVLAFEPAVAMVGDRPVVAYRAETLLPTLGQRPQPMQIGDEHIEVVVDPTSSPSPQPIILPGSSNVEMVHPFLSIACLDSGACVIILQVSNRAHGSTDFYAWWLDSKAGVAKGLDKIVSFEQWHEEQAAALVSNHIDDLVLFSAGNVSKGCSLPGLLELFATHVAPDGAHGNPVLITPCRDYGQHIDRINAMHDAGAYRVTLQSIGSTFQRTDILRISNDVVEELHSEPLKFALFCRSSGRTLLLLDDGATTEVRDAVNMTRLWRIDSLGFGREINPIFPELAAEDCALVWRDYRDRRESGTGANAEILDDINIYGRRFGPDGVGTEFLVSDSTLPLPSGCCMAPGGESISDGLASAGLAFAIVLALRWRRKGS